MEATTKKISGFLRSSSATCPLATHELGSSVQLDLTATLWRTNQVNTPFVRTQEEMLGGEVVAWSQGFVGEVPQPVVLCGPSGVGKSSLIRKLIENFPDTFGFSVSHTTRPPREQEVHGVHYHFTTREVMDVEIEEGKFLEYAEVHGNLYGTSLASIEAVANSHKVGLSWWMILKHVAS